MLCLAGFALDNLSLLACNSGTGIVVDDAIVMIENIVRNIEDGEPPLQAALRGAKQIGFTVISLTLSLIAVFIPLLFMTGLVGRMSLKEIVRESTDLVERLCIEAALSFTSDNRASAAEILGLSRQSLYSKLHRHGLGNLVSDDS